MFLTYPEDIIQVAYNETRRNPLKSGQCFLLSLEEIVTKLRRAFCVAIPSNRVNVSYLFALRA